MNKPSVRLVGSAEELESLRHARPLWGNGHVEPALAAGYHELRAVLDPYLKQVPEDQRELLVDAFWHRKTQEELAAERGITQSPVARRLETARKALVRVIALTDPVFAASDEARRRGTRGRPARDYEGELDAAWNVLRRDLVLQEQSPTR
jgi:uncharacterized membrane protein